VRGSFDKPSQIDPHTLAGPQKTFLAADEQENCPDLSFFATLRNGEQALISVPLEDESRIDRCPVFR